MRTPRQSHPLGRPIIPCAYHYGVDSVEMPDCDDGIAYQQYHKASASLELCNQEYQAPVSGPSAVCERAPQKGLRCELKVTGRCQARRDG